MVVKRITNKSQPLVVNKLDTIILDLIRSYEGNVWPTKNGWYKGVSKIRLQELLKDKSEMPKRMDTLNNHLRKLQDIGLIVIYELSPGVIYLSAVAIDTGKKEGTQ